MMKGKVLAIDYGQKSIGLAVSDADRMMAFGRGVLRNIDRDGTLKSVLLMIDSEDISEVVIGLPLGKNGEETVQTKIIRDFADELSVQMRESKIEIPVTFLDESFSSFEANIILMKLGVKSEDRKKTEDEMAAIVLIHRFIDFRP